MLCLAWCGVQDVALALESHEAFVREVFGAPAVLDLVAGLQVRRPGEPPASPA